MKCHSCGCEIDENAVFCSNCGAEIAKADAIMDEQGNFLAEKPLQNDSTEEMPHSEPKEKFYENPTKLTILAVLLFFNVPTILVVLLSSALPNSISTAISSAISPLAGTFSMIGLALLIYIRIKFPHYLAAKILLWIAVILLIAFVVLIIWLFVACIQAIQGCPG